MLDYSVVVVWKQVLLEFILYCLIFQLVYFLPGALLVVQVYPSVVNLGDLAKLGVLKWVRHHGSVNLLTPLPVEYVLATSVLAHAPSVDGLYDPSHSLTFIQAALVSGSLHPVLQGPSEGLLQVVTLLWRVGAAVDPLAVSL